MRPTTTNSERRRVGGDIIRIEKGPIFRDSVGRSVDGGIKPSTKSLSFDVISVLLRNSSRKVFERKRSCRTLLCRLVVPTPNNIRIHSGAQVCERAQGGFPPRAIFCLPSLTPAWRMCPKSLFDLKGNIDTSDRDRSWPARSFHNGRIIPRPFHPTCSKG